MKLIKIISNTYIDKDDQIWIIKARRGYPVIKQYIEKIINITKEAVDDFKKPLAYHFVVRLNEGKTISNFLDALKKFYLYNYGFQIKYVHAKECDGATIHHHIFLFIDSRFVNPKLLSFFLMNHTGDDKLLFCYGLRKSKLGQKRTYMTMRTEDEVRNVVHRASYLAKTRTKVFGEGLIQMTTSRIRKQRIGEASNSAPTDQQLLAA